MLLSGAQRSSYLHRLAAAMKRFMLLCAVLNAGCAGMYQQADESQPHAKLTIRFTENNLTAGGAQLFYAFDNANCVANQGAALGSLSWATSKEKVVRLRTGSRTYIQVATTGIRPGLQACPSGVGMCMTKQDCVNVVSLIPEPDKSYSIKHNVEAGRCSVSLVEADSKVAPSTYATHPVSEGCKM